MTEIGDWIVWAPGRAEVKVGRVVGRTKKYLSVQEFWRGKAVGNPAPLKTVYYTKLSDINEMVQKESSHR